MGPLQFLLYVNDIWRVIDSSNRLFANICNIRVTYVKHTNNNDIVNLQKVLDTLGEWAVENGMKINPGKRKTIRFTRALVKNPVGYSLGFQKFRKGTILNTME
jgi:hypothetical protein